MSPFNHFKTVIKRLFTQCWFPLFRGFKKFRKICSLYPKGRNHLFDIISYRQSSEKMIVMDVGANVGQTALEYLQVLKNVVIHSFEPINETFEILKINTGKIQNIHEYNFALGSKEEKVMIGLADTSVNNSLVTGRHITGEHKTQEVTIKTLDFFCQEKNIQKIHLLKIDTEGFDLEVLKGVTEMIKKEAIDHIYCEVGFNDEPHKVNFDMILNYLKPFGYQFSGLYEVNRFGKSYLNVFYANALFTLRAK